MADDQQQDGHPEEVTLLDYVVGELGPDSSDAIRRHVERCPSCRDRIVDLALDMDEIDRLPMAAIPHDILRGTFSPEHSLTGRRRSVRRTVPLLLLIAAAFGIVALFQLGDLRAAGGGTSQRQLVLQTSAADPVAVIDELLGGVPHSVVVDRDDERHLVVLVGDADVAVAYARLSDATTAGGRTYVIDLGASGALPTSTG